MIGHGITRDLIGHPVPDNATAGANILDVVTVVPTVVGGQDLHTNVEYLSGTILFLNL